jgi:hypothetical protein
VLAVQLKSMLGRDIPLEEVSGIGAPPVEELTTMIENSMPVTISVGELTALRRDVKVMRIVLSYLMYKGKKDYMRFTKEMFGELPSETYLQSMQSKDSPQQYEFRLIVKGESSANKEPQSDTGVEG